MNANVTVHYLDPAELRPAPYNPRTISDESLHRLAALLDAHGFVDPIIARSEDKLVIGGHQRLKANALRRFPDAAVPVVLLEGVSDDRAKALNVALNNPAAQGEYDMPAVADLLGELDTDAFDLAAFTGFSADDVSGLLDGIAEDVADVSVPESYQVVVECDDEARQRTVYERLQGEGYSCRLLTL